MNLKRSLAIFAVVIIGVAVSSALAQPTGYVEISAFKTPLSKKYGCSQLKEGVVGEANLAELRKIPNCVEHLPILNSSEAEFQTLVYFSVGSDCHMRVESKVFRVDAEKKYKVIINNIYGGCRAGGRRSGWLAFEKVPENYEVEIVEVRPERTWHRDREQPFEFPKPPTTKSQAPLAIREVDLGECLPMTGQSQWVLADREALDKALNDEKPECKVNEERSGLDLSKEALVGYRFHSGYCERPFGLRFDAIHETSSDPKEDRLMIKARFDAISDEYCKVWSTYPVWLVVDKPKGHVRYEFFAEPIK